MKEIEALTGKINIFVIFVMGHKFVKNTQNKQKTCKECKLKLLYDFFVVLNNIIIRKRGEDEIEKNDESMKAEFLQYWNNKKL